ncbi:hypothetical protein B0T26DRAFT_696170 [Lasiosphaeria miniovina]|uniref:Uncharacterized protein n=1 Tax=Lasiosphaeria miniovina TaxID=1954250 RepID=A0AA40B578_9PEZI|nr:uncharacterized protein B0T26DRAFT_696170 [Lasiosphaeria miniovina]KAK0727949.1 hypothetical protein B0T26DRAFT_696170 [Lasiosphaeria miniovina]
MVWQLQFQAWVRAAPAATCLLPDTWAGTLPPSIAMESGHDIAILTDCESHSNHRPKPMIPLEKGGQDEQNGM